MKRIKTIAFYFFILVLLVAGMSIDISAGNKPYHLIQVTKAADVKYVRSPYNKDFRERHIKTHRLQRGIQSGLKHKCRKNKKLIK